MNAIAVYDFTLKEDGVTVKDLSEFCKNWSKKWVFQLEQGDGGYRHYQGRLSLIKKRRVGELVKAVQTKYTWPFHWSPTSSNAVDEEFYCTKEDTRIEGPWKNTDEEVYIPRQIREIHALYPWQQHILDDANVWNTRTINLVVDITGNNGKSILKTYIGVHGIGRSIPFCNDYKDIMRIVMDTPKKRLYIIDMPRSVNKDRLYGLMSGIETIKDGYAYDDRYSFKEQYFDCPNIWVFSNKQLDMEYLSIDRWRIWRINEDKGLLEWGGLP